MRNKAHPHFLSFGKKSCRVQVGTLALKSHCLQDILCRPEKNRVVCSGNTLIIYYIAYRKSENGRTLIHAEFRWFFVLSFSFLIKFSKINA
jgi:hypothetical protein